MNGVAFLRRWFWLWLLGLAAIALSILALADNARLFVVTALNGLTLAALYFLVASGFTLVFGLLRNVNLAHGSLYLLGAYVGWMVGEYTDSWLLAVAAGFLFAALMGLLLQIGVFRYMHGEDLRQTMATIALSIIAADIALWIWGGQIYQFDPPRWIIGSTALPIVGKFATYRLVLLAMAIVIGLALWWFLARTRVGMMIRAGVDDRAMLSASGVNVQMVFAITFAIGAGLASDHDDGCRAIGQHLAGVASHRLAPRLRAGRRAGLSLGRAVVLHLPDRRPGADPRPDRFVAHLPGGLRRHAVVGADDRGRHRRLHRRHPGRQRHARDQPGLAMVAGRRAGGHGRHGRRHVHRLAVGAHRGHLHHHDHAGDRHGVLLSGPAELRDLQRLPGLPESRAAGSTGHRLAHGDAVLLPRPVLGARRLLLREIPDQGTVRRRAPGRARQRPAHERARLQPGGASRRGLCRRRPDRLGRRRAAGLVQRADHARLGRHLVDDQHPDRRRPRRHAPSHRAVHRRRGVRVAAELRHRPDRSRAVQPGDRPGLSGDRAVLARRPAGLVGQASRLGDAAPGTGAHAHTGK